MYRYKAPSIPFIAIIAAYGSDRIIHGVIAAAKASINLAAAWRKGKQPLFGSGIKEPNL